MKTIFGFTIILCCAQNALASKQSATLVQSAILVTVAKAKMQTHLLSIAQHQNAIKDLELECAARKIEAFHSFLDERHKGKTKKTRGWALEEPRLSEEHRLFEQVWNNELNRK